MSILRHSLFPVFLGVLIFFSACNFQDEKDAQNVSDSIYKIDSMQAYYMLQKVNIAEAINDSLQKDSTHTQKFRPVELQLPEISDAQRKHKRKEEPKIAETDTLPVKKDSTVSTKK